MSHYYLLIRFAGSVILREGDIVTFGHPYGVRLPPGIRKRQPESEYQFIVRRKQLINHYIFKGLMSQ